MSIIHWDQWDSAEKRVELDAYQSEYEDDKIAEGEPEGCCSGCLYCLGLSWRDFV